MAWGTGTKLLAVTAAVATAGWIARDRAAKKRRRKARGSKVTGPPPKSRDPSCLFKTFVEDQALGPIDSIWNDLHPDLQTPEVAETVIDIEPDQAKVAYEYMLHLIYNKGHTLSDGVSRDDAIRQTVAVIASGCDWSEGLGPYTYQSPFQRVWTGVGTLGELAEANLAAKMAEDEEEGED